MNATPTYNNRYMVIFIAILIVVLLVLALNVMIWVSLTGGGMMMGGMMNHMMGMNGQTMNDMIAACTNMMQNFQSP